MNDMLNMQKRLACTRTFFMPDQICKDTYVVLFRIFENRIFCLPSYGSLKLLLIVLGYAIGFVVCAIFVDSRSKNLTVVDIKFVQLGFYS